MDESLNDNKAAGAPSALNIGLERILLPCPFCGGNKLLCGAQPSDADWVCVFCADCKTEGPHVCSTVAEPEQDAAAAWNMRSNKA